MVAELFLRLKNVKMLLLLREKKKWYVSLLAKEADVTYPHAIQIIKKLEQAGLVKTAKDGRNRYVELTDKGREVAIALEAAYHQLSKLQS